MTQKNFQSFGTLSIASSFYNEAKNVLFLWRELEEVCKIIKVNEFVFIDNGSSDDTFEELKKLRNLDNRVLLIQNKAPSSYSKGFSTALRNSSSDYTLLIHSDLQADIEIYIRRLIKEIRNSKINLSKKDLIFLSFRKNRKNFERVLTFLNIRIASAILGWERNYDFNSHPKIIPTKHLKSFSCNDSYTFDLVMVDYLIKRSKSFKSIEFFEPIPVNIKTRKYGESSWSKSPFNFLKIVFSYIYCSIKLRLN